MKSDNICKYLAEEYPSDFAGWLLWTESPEVRVLNTELTLEPIQMHVTFEKNQRLIAFC